MLNLIPLFCQTHVYNYRKPHPNTDGGNVEKRCPDTWTLSPKRILISLTYIAECATNHSLRFSTGSEFSKTMEIRGPATKIKRGAIEQEARTMYSVPNVHRNICNKSLNMQ